MLVKEEAHSEVSFSVEVEERNVLRCQTSRKSPNPAKRWMLPILCKCWQLITRRGQRGRVVRAPEFKSTLTTKLELFLFRP